MVTRRVKRIKRSKKQVHRARGRKTNRRRYTRRQRGGRKITVCERSGFDLIGTSTGITISYDDETQKYTIGNESYAKLKSMPRYIPAMDIVDEHIRRVFTHEAPVVLTQTEFNTFKENYCSVYAPTGGKKQCESINSFKPPVAAAAAAAAAAPVAEVPKMSPNVLMIDESMIAYNNNHGVMRSVTLDKSKTNYEFDNFIIPNNISGKLKVQFVPGDPVVTRFKLELSMSSSITPQLIECVKGIDDLVVNIETVSNSFSAMVITGTLTEQKDYELKKSTYDFNSFVMKFAKCHDAKLEKQMAVLSVDEHANPTIKSIQSTLNTTVEHITTLMSNIASYEKNNPAKLTALAALNEISVEAGALHMSCNDLTRTLMRLPEPEQAQLDVINTQASELFRNVKRLLAKCERITFPSS